MTTTASLLAISPVLSSDNLERDIKWYETYVGFNLNYLEEILILLKLIIILKILINFCTKLYNVI